MYYECFWRIQLWLSNVKRTINSVNKLHGYDKVAIGMPMSLDQWRVLISPVLETVIKYVMGY